MRIESIIISDFYNNVDEVREFALSQEFSVSGNFPNVRTKSFLDENIKKGIQNIIEPISGRITWWGDNYSGSYQYTTATNRSFVHVDTTDWAGVCYLTPDAPLSGGTGLFRHKKSKITTFKPKNDFENKSAEHFKDYLDVTKWELVDRVGNLYNRLILYRGDLFHTSLDYFGLEKNDGRLFQTFFFNTQY